MNASSETDIEDTWLELYDSTVSSDSLSCRGLKCGKKKTEKIKFDKIFAEKNFPNDRSRLALKK